MNLQRFKIAKYTHCLDAQLKVNNTSYAQEVLSFFRRNLRYDLDKKGDITTQLLLAHKFRKVKACLLSKSSGIIAGIEELTYFLENPASLKPRLFTSKIKLRVLKKDGQNIKKGELIAYLEGEVHDILKLERTMLNFLQRMSGIATAMSELVSHVPSSVLVTPTRKTLWGILDKKACTVGGGGTHRLHLSDAVLLKDTHLDLFKHDFGKILKPFLNRRVKTRFIEIEVEKIDEAMAIARLVRNYQTNPKSISAKQTFYLCFGLPFYIMLDNIKPPEIKNLVKMLKKEKLFNLVLLEASGGINTKNIHEYGKSGIDIVSIGAVTHSAPALDISLKIST